jgi:3-hydroxyisobutyrate dehydrogenase-like beta-hydroxyacid dehydrogenase
MGILKQFPYYAPTFDSKLPRMLEHAYADPGFTCQLMMKDVGLAATEARRLGVDARLLEGLQSLYGLAVKSGQSESDYSAIHEALRPLAPG